MLAIDHNILTMQILK